MKLARARRHCRYFAVAGSVGSFETSRRSCWMITVASRLATIFLARSSEASV
jgi:hypothetical protein